jgi:hypothetical protein
MRNWIYNRSEKHIALVTHGGFLHYFTEDWTGYLKGKGVCPSSLIYLHSSLADLYSLLGTGYLNCEYRKLEFTEDSNEKESHLRECGSALEKQARSAGLDAHLIHEIEEVEKAS